MDTQPFFYHYVIRLSLHVCQYGDADFFLYPYLYAILASDDSFPIDDQNDESISHYS